MPKTLSVIDLIELVEELPPHYLIDISDINTGEYFDATGITVDHEIEVVTLHAD